MALSDDIHTYLLKALAERSDWRSFDPDSFTKHEAIEFVTVLLNGDPTFKAQDPGNSISNINTHVLLLKYPAEPDESAAPKIHSEFARFKQAYDVADKQLSDLVFDLLTHSSNKLKNGISAIAAGPTTNNLKLSDKQLMSLLSRRLLNIRSLQFRQPALVSVLKLFGASELTLSMTVCTAPPLELLPEHLQPWQQVIAKVDPACKKMTPAAQLLHVTRYASGYLLEYVQQCMQMYIAPAC
jgi:hypothetical protein